MSAARSYRPAHGGRPAATPRLMVRLRRLGDAITAAGTFAGVPAAYLNAEPDSSRRALGLRFEQAPTAYSRSSELGRLSDSLGLGLTETPSPPGSAPWEVCPRCEGSGRGNPLPPSRSGPGPCGRCGGTGKAVRPGA